MPYRFQRNSNQTLPGIMEIGGRMLHSSCPACGRYTRLLETGNEFLLGKSSLEVAEVAEAA